LVQGSEEVGYIPKSLRVTLYSNEKESMWETKGNVPIIPHMKAQFGNWGNSSKSLNIETRVSQINPLSNLVISFNGSSESSCKGLQ
jgi:hypothetical protein